MTADVTRATMRDRSGRYDYAGRWERICRCGHMLGHHTAEAPHSCIAADFVRERDVVDCQCGRFKERKA